MRALEPAYPSFTLVLTNAGKDSLRLPAYRASHKERYHPYPRYPRRSADCLMQTVDYRDIGAPSRSTSLNAPHTSSPLGADVANLDIALHADDEAAAEGDRKLSALIIDLALAIRQHWQIMRRVTIVVSAFKFERHE
ncbi:hypothetical protein OBBRIDRAFT_790314 [Obba rivulosa]|uniref:Uncharacterized protein n=1 Tax=Obba rivulosa TaxID=1052685 RepID=A0A8E2J2R3_9APHY|nr:hypothetical protein OBBRIDRAFT_790314 [Obba rivulosa]